jgi:hypothetical protein
LLFCVIASAASPVPHIADGPVIRVAIFLEAVSIPNDTNPSPLLARGPLCCSVGLLPRVRLSQTLIVQSPDLPSCLRLCLFPTTPTQVYRWHEGRFAVLCDCFLGFACPTHCLSDHPICLVSGGCVYSERRGTASAGSSVPRINCPVTRIAVFLEAVSTPSDTNSSPLQARGFRLCCFV